MNVTPSIWQKKQVDLLDCHQFKSRKGGWCLKKNTKKSQLNKPHEPRWKSWSDTKKSPEFEQESAPLHWHWHESGICFRPFIGAVADSLLDHFGIWNSHPSQPVLFRQCLRLLWTHRIPETSPASRFWVVSLFNHKKGTAIQHIFLPVSSMRVVSLFPNRSPKRRREEGA